MRTGIKEKIAVFWFRRDLRLEDNAALSAALKSKLPILPLFIFDADILERLQDRDDARVTFIHQTVSELHEQLQEFGSSLRVEHGKPSQIWRKLLGEYQISEVYFNRDYEPAAIERDSELERLMRDHGALVSQFKDQVIFEKKDITKDDGKPYTVFTPYSRKWKAKFQEECLKTHSCLKNKDAFLKWKAKQIPSLSEIGFEISSLEFPSTRVDRKVLTHYADRRNLPHVRGTSRLGLHLRFGTVSVRELVKAARLTSETWLNELIWREFFMQILWNFPHVVGSAFRPEYDKIKWRNNKTEFKRWCEGRTGYPIVDAGMRELNETGFMHNRVRMIAGSFLVKHLLIDWKWGEEYFARKLLDFELASNNGNWQWVAGTGCDAAPYFRVFNPTTQEKKFDPQQAYIKTWVSELNTKSYPEPVVDHVLARKRALEAYASALGRTAPASST